MKHACLTALCFGFWMMAACSGSSTSSDTDPSDEEPSAKKDAGKSSHEEPETKDEKDAGKTDPPAPGKTGLRFINAAFQVGSVDYCIRAKGKTAWDGPLLEGLGIAEGAAELQQTRIFERAAGDWEVAVVDDSATSCDKVIAQSKAAITISGGKPALAIVFGNGGLSSVEVAALEDDVEVEKGKSKVRFFHASTGWSSDTKSVSVDRASGAKGLFTGVKYGMLATASSEGSPDGAGYVTLAPTTENIVVNGLKALGVSSTTAKGKLTAKAGAGTTLVFAGQVESGFFPPLVASCLNDVGTAKDGDALVDCQ